MRIQQRFALHEKIPWKTGLIGQANGSKESSVFYRLTLIRALLKDDFQLHVEYYVNEVIQTIWLVNMLIILSLKFWYAMMQ